MAKWISTAYSAGRARFGGVVLSANKHANTMRAMAVPAGAATAKARPAAMLFQSAAVQWATLSGYDVFFWYLSGNWLAYANIIANNTPVAPYAYFAAAFAIAALFGTNPQPDADSPDNTMDIISGFDIEPDAGLYYIKAFQGSGAPYQYAFVMSCILLPANFAGTTPTSGYVQLIGVSGSGYGQFSTAFAAAFGYLPEPGMTLAVSLSQYWPTSFLPGQYEDHHPTGRQAQLIPPYVAIVTL